MVVTKLVLVALAGAELKSVGVVVPSCWERLEPGREQWEVVRLRRTMPRDRGGFFLHSLVAAGGTWPVRREGDRLVPRAVDGPLAVAEVMSFLYRGTPGAGAGSSSLSSPSP